MVTVTINIKGLAISCVNKGAEKAELALLRNEEHCLEITIKKMDEYDDIIKYPSGSIEPKQPINISAVNPKLKSIDINDNGQHDPQDFSYIVDIESVDFNNKPLPPARLPHQLLPMNPLYISNAYFYTAKLTMNDVYRIKLINGIPAPTIKNIGKVGVEIGAKIEADEVVFSVNGVQTSLNENGAHYTIEIDNECDDATMSDFLLYYEILKDPNNVKYALVFEEPKLRSLTPPAVCNGTGRGRTGSIGDLFV